MLPRSSDTSISEFRKGTRHDRLDALAADLAHAQRHAAFRQIAFRGVEIDITKKLPRPPRPQVRLQARQQLLRIDALERCRQLQLQLRLDGHAVPVHFSPCGGTLMLSFAATKLQNRVSLMTTPVKSGRL
jgi:hypothetical protein